MEPLRKIGLRAAAVVVIVQALAARMYAAGAGQGLPWERPMASIASSLAGPIAYGIAIIGIAVTFGMLLFHHELGHVGAKAVVIALAVAVLVYSGAMLSSAFGVAGAVI